MTARFDAQAQIDSLEHMLSQIDAQRVLAVPVLGYIEPAGRAVRAQADKAAGIGLPATLTAAQIVEIRAGTREAPSIPIPRDSEIYHAKQQIVHLRVLQSRIDDPQRVRAQADATS
jgi:hypothetical protein